MQLIFVIASMISGRYTGLRIFFLLHVLSSILSPQSSLEQNTIYEKLLDRILSIEKSASHLRFEIRLRYKPSFHPERQVVIRQTVDGKASITYSEAATQVSKLLEEIQTDASIEKAARQVKRVVVTSPIDASTAQELLRGMFESFNNSTSELVASLLAGEQDGTVTVQLDGTEYTIDYEGSQQRFSLTIVGSEIGATSIDSDVIVVRWMNQVLKKAQELAHLR
jgi:hypothetical protein